MKFLGWVLCFCCYMIMHCIPFVFSQCFMHLDVCLYVENCVLIGLDWVEPMIEFFFCISHVHAFFFMHTYPFFSIFLYYFFMVLFCLSPSLLNSLRMTPNCKSASSWNPLYSETSSFDPTPLQPWYSFGMPRGSIRFFRYCFTHCHSQSGMGISM